MELYQASNQWANRPADERFRSLEEMYDACHGYAIESRQSTFTFRNSKVIANNGEVILQGKTGAKARFTNFAFGQVATKIGAPAEYLRRLPAELAATNLNYGFQHFEEDKPSKGLFHIQNKNLICRCVTSEVYRRIWNYEIIERLLPLPSIGWKTPPSMTDSLTPSGLYASDHDMFVFLVNDDRRIEDGSEGGLARGFFVSNSEVGQASFKLTTFYYRFICGNHIVWGAENVQRIRIIHKGEPASNWDSRLCIELKKYANVSANQDQQKISSAKQLLLGTSKDEVIENLFSKRTLGITKKDLESGYELASMDYELTKVAQPNSVWGMVQGLTRHSQSKPYGDERTKLDVATGKILEMAF